MGIRISEMEEATTFGADDYVPIVTNGTNKKALGQKIKDFIAGFFATKTGDNISDKATFRSAIEISATNTPFDKTGTGMSAENVQAGIVELSENRALINGSNIANPSAFRQNIGVNKIIVGGVLPALALNNGNIRVSLSAIKGYSSISCSKTSNILMDIYGSINSGRVNATLNPRLLTNIIILDFTPNITLSNYTDASKIFAIDCEALELTLS